MKSLHTIEENGIHFVPVSEDKDSIAVKAVQDAAIVYFTRQNNFTSKDIEAVACYETSIEVFSRDESKIKSGKYRIALNKETTKATGGTSKSLNKLKLVPVNSVTEASKELLDELQGLSANLTVEDIAEIHKVTVEQINEQLEKGIQVELEHTQDEDIAYKIALDHLVEFPDYYDRLERLESMEKLDAAPQQITEAIHEEELENEFFEETKNNRTTSDNGQSFTTHIVSTLSGTEYLVSTVSMKELEVAETAIFIPGSEQWGLIPVWAEARKDFENTEAHHESVLKKLYRGEIKEDDFENIKELSKYMKSAEYEDDTQKEDIYFVAIDFQKAYYDSLQEQEVYPALLQSVASLEDKLYDEDAILYFDYVGQQNFDFISNRDSYEHCKKAAAIINDFYEGLIYATIREYTYHDDDYGALVESRSKGPNQYDYVIDLPGYQNNDIGKFKISVIGDKFVHSSGAFQRTKDSEFIWVDLWYKFNRVNTTAKLLTTWTGKTPYIQEKLEFKLNTVDEDAVAKLSVEIVNKHLIGLIEKTEERIKEFKSQAYTVK